MRREESFMKLIRTITWVVGLQLVVALAAFGQDGYKVQTIGLRRGMFLPPSRPRSIHRGFG